MKTPKCIIFTVCLSLLVLNGLSSCKSSKETTDSLSVRGLYSNPVIAESTPDPTIIQLKNGDFYLYAAENIKNTPIYKSTNLID
ncbi:MAG: arabinan endo-1,5-alpha-L-arabinosidase, partial [Bacteroides sp.]|nr:arabinan endo-1,5-alpha-L-arabinosidase [Bacteroides sp.]